MTEHPHEDVRRLFDLVLDVPAAQRESVLDRECTGDEGLKQRILAMIEAAEDDRFLADATAEAMHGSNAGAATVAASPREQVGEQIGRYKLLEQIGEGGFGTVWAAEQREPVKRRVALKIIKLGMDTKQVIARFEAERQALAMMDHPNIAKVLDAGSTETGRPFFVMELVKGVPVLDYCDREKLDTKARLDLFMKVCHAIQHAHQKGIIHRDIKPSNVMITLHDGVPVPKVIDFGIAKATNQELTNKTIYTQHHQMIGTPAYMSPEQAEMSGLDIDTRSDIYALGVLLYELLTGTTPFENDSLMQAGFAEMMRIIREDTPHKPSTRLSSMGDTGTRTAEQRRTDLKHLGSALRGDLDWIVMKCLEKDRTRRYETANGLAADIRRHLDDEPVIAGPPSTRYRLKKFVKRNRAGVLGGSVIAAILIVGLAGTSYGLLEARTQAELAARRAGELEQVADFQSEQLGAIVPELMGAHLRDTIIAAAPEEQRAELRTTLGRINFTDIGLASMQVNVFEPALEAIGAQFESQPLVEAQLLQALADTLTTLGLLDVASDPQERAIAIHRTTLGDDHPDTLSSINTMGELLLWQGRYDDAETYYREALEGRHHVLGDDHPDTLASINNMGSLLSAQGSLDAAEPYCREALEGYRRVLGDNHPDTLDSIDIMGSLLQAQGKLDAAEPLLRESLEGRRHALGDNHSRTLDSINRMGVLLQAQGKLDAADPYFREALERCRRSLGDDHPSTLASINNTGSLLSAQGSLDAAEPYYREALEGFRRVLGDDHPSTLIAINSMGGLLSAQFKLDEAEKYAREALEGCRRVLGDDHPDTLAIVYNMSGLLSAQGKLDEAEPYRREALEGFRRVLGDDHPYTLTAINSMGLLLSNQGKLDAAEPYYREALEGQRRVLGDDHPDTLTSINSMGLLLSNQGKLDEAEPYYREALEGQRRVLGDDHPDTLVSINNMGFLLKAQGKLAAAEPYYREALDGSRRVHGDEHPRTLTSINNMGSLLSAQGSLDAAEPYCREALEGYRRVLGDDHPRTLNLMNNLGYLLDARGKLDAAEPYYREALEGRRRTLGDDDPDTLASIRNMGLLLESLGKYDAAEPLLLERYAALDASFADEQRTQVLPPAAEELVALYEAWGKPEKAAEWRQRLAELTAEPEVSP